MTLSEAIAAVEAAQTGLANSDTVQAAAQAKFDAAVLAKTSADTDEQKAVEGFNASLDALIATATAAKKVKPL